MEFLELKVVEGWEKDKYIFMDDWCATYVPYRNYECEHSVLAPHLGEKLLVFMMKDFYDVFKFCTVIATVNGMTMQNWINEIPRMEISSIVNDNHIVVFLDAVRSRYNIDINKTKVTMANIKIVKTHLESFTQSTKEIEWLLNTLPVLEFLYNKYGQEIK